MRKSDIDYTEWKFQYPERPGQLQSTEIIHVLYDIVKGIALLQARTIKGKIYDPLWKLKHPV